MATNQLLSTVDIPTEVQRKRRKLLQDVFNYHTKEREPGSMSSKEVLDSIPTENSRRYQLRLARLYESLLSAYHLDGIPCYEDEVAEDEGEDDDEGGE